MGLLFMTFDAVQLKVVVRRTMDLISRYTVDPTLEVVYPKFEVGGSTLRPGGTPLNLTPASR